MKLPADVETVKGEVPTQRQAETRRTAEPKARLVPVWHRLPDAITRQEPVAGIDQHMESDTGRTRILLKPCKRRFIHFRSRVEEVHCLARHPAVLGQLLHPGDEGRDPDTAPNPDLDWTLGPRR